MFGPNLAIGIGAGGRSFSPAQIGSQHFWFAANALTGLSNDDPVVALTDQSPEGNDALQATGTKRGLYKTNVQNGLPGVLFDGTDDYYEATLGASLSQPNTIFAVTKRDAATGTYRILEGPGATRNLIDYKSNDALELYAGSIINSGATTLGADAVVITVQFNGASTIGRKNGTQILAADGGAQACGGFIIGIGNDFSTAPFKGHIFELLFYNAALTAAQIASVESYLSTKYDI